MKILVVVDMQYDFTTGPLGNKECVAVIPNVISAIKNDTYDHIIFTKDTHQNNYLQTQEGQKLPVPHCIEGSDGWNIVDEVFCTADGKHIDVVCKPTFGSIELGGLLERYSDESEEPVEVDFCGVCTGICVISNAMITKAFIPEAKVCIIEKACACVTPQSHQTAIEAMRTCQIDII